MKNLELCIIFQDGERHYLKLENKQEVEKKIDEVFKEGIKFQVDEYHYSYPPWAILKTEYLSEGASKSEVVVLD